MYRQKAGDDPSDQDTYIIMYLKDSFEANCQKTFNSYSYFKALERAYDIIFEINLKNNTVDCIYGRETSSIGSTYDITMTVDSAIDYWVKNYILPEDKEVASDMFRRIVEQRELDDSDRALQMEVGLKLDNGEIVYYIAVVVQVTEDSALLCCRNITNVKYLEKKRLVENDEGEIFVRTFGHFDVFVNDKTIRFNNKREKELFAILIDRNGGNLSSEMAITMLWEHEPISDNIRTAYRKTAMGLKNTLTEYGVENILINRRGVRSLDTSKIKCDYYEFLKGNDKYKNLFHGVYMPDYSWAEETLALLIQNS